MKARVIDHFSERDRSTDARTLVTKVDRSEQNYVYRAQIKKGAEIAILSHLDYVDVYRRALIRSKLPAAYSQGFNPHMKLALASALAVGTTSDAEYMDFELTERLEASDVMARLNAQLPRGAELVRLKRLTGKATALMALADAAIYEIECGFDGDESAARRSIGEFNRAASVSIMRITPKKTREIELKEFILAPIGLSVLGARLRLTVEIKISTVGSVKPIEVLTTLKEKFLFRAEESNVRIHRLMLTSEGRDLFDI